MKIGVPKEIKNNEYRVGLTPKSVVELVKNNHEVFVQANAGSEIGFLNKDYEKAVEWYTKAAEAGNANAQCNLGICYDK